MLPPEVLLKEGPLVLPSMYVTAWGAGGAGGPAAGGGGELHYDPSDIRNVWRAERKTKKRSTKE